MRGDKLAQEAVEQIWLIVGGGVAGVGHDAHLRIRDPALETIPRPSISPQVTGSL